MAPFFYRVNSGVYDNEGSASPGLEVICVLCVVAISGTLRVYDEVKTQVRTLVKVSRSYFPDNATQEMLDEFRPMLCSCDRSMWVGFKYLSLFLPTTMHVDNKLTYKLWLEEFLNLWRTFGNGPAWEVSDQRVIGLFAT